MTNKYGTIIFGDGYEWAFRAALSITTVTISYTVPPEHRIVRSTSVGRTPGTQTQCGTIPKTNLVESLSSEGGNP